MLTDQVVDEQALVELRGIMGDDFQLLIDTFISDSEQRVNALHEALATEDTELLRTSAHSFKGSALNISALRLTALCRELETRGREGHLEGAETVLAELLKAYLDVKTYFRV